MATKSLSESFFIYDAYRFFGYGGFPQYKGNKPTGSIKSVAVGIKIGYGHKKQFMRGMITFRRSTNQKLELSKDAVGKIKRVWLEWGYTNDEKMFNDFI